MSTITRQVIPKLNLSTISRYKGNELQAITYRFRGGPIRRGKGGRFGAVSCTKGGRFGVAGGADSAWIKLSFYTVVVEKSQHPDAALRVDIPANAGTGWITNAQRMDNPDGLPTRCTLVIRLAHTTALAQSSWVDTTLPPAFPFPASRVRWRGGRWPIGMIGLRRLDTREEFYFAHDGR